jgi:hypothetical protein
MRLSHARSAIRVRFDDPNLVSCAGLVPVMALAARCGLTSLLADGLTLAGKGTANAAAKIQALIAGMVAGADSISDMDLLRHSGMGRVFDDVRAPSTLGTFLRRFTFGHVRQLDAVAARLLTRLAAATPLLPGADRWMFCDIDDTVRQTYGYAKQGAGRGYTGVKGLNALLAVLSTPLSAPVIAATRLRRGSTNSARGAGSCWPTRLPLPGEPQRPEGCWCARTRPTTATTSSTPVDGPGPVLGHRPPHPGRNQGHHHDPGHRVGGDPLPERDLRRGRATVGV